MSETSTKPYLLRALYEWCTDNGYTPHIAVRVDSRTRVPREFVRDGEIVLNVSFDATNKLSLGNDQIEFEARFSGKVFHIDVPVENVLAIYARENGQGMAFQVDDTPSDRGEAGGGSTSGSASESAGEAADIPAGAARRESALQPVADTPGGARNPAGNNDDGDDDKPPPPDDGPRTGRPHLKVVK